MSTIAFALVVLSSLGGLYVWAGKRARTLRRQAAEREQAAMALLLGARPQADDDAPVVAQPIADGPRKVVGRLLDDDVTEKAAALARKAADHRGNGQNGKSLPPLEYEGRNGHGQREPSAAEQAAADLDPIEDLISQIMVDEPVKPQRRPSAEATPSSPPVRSRAAEPAQQVRRGEIAPNVALRELALAWYEARGYRGSPASPAVWPIELVLRHREDAARAYAFVVQADVVSVDRITALIEQAREIGMMRVAVIAEAGYERGAKDIARKRNVRLIDRATMEAELSELQLPTAAKIIAVARTRSSAEPSPA